MSYFHYSSECGDYHDLVVDFKGPRPTIVVLCGSTRFPDAFRQAAIQETLAGRVVLSIGVNLRDDYDLHQALADSDRAEVDPELAAVKAELDDLHKRKIDLADEVLVVSDESGYYGASTASEIAYATKLGKPIRYQHPAAEARTNADNSKPVPDNAGQPDGAP